MSSFEEIEEAAATFLSVVLLIVFCLVVFIPILLLPALGIAICLKGYLAIGVFLTIVFSLISLSAFILFVGWLLDLLLGE